MKKTKLLLVAVLSAFMIATLAGCAGSSGGGSSDDSSGGSGESGGSGGSGGKTSNGITTKNQSINPVIFDDSEVPEDYDERDTNYNTLYIILSDGTWEETQVHDWKTEIDEYYLTYTVKEGDDPEMTCTAAKKVYKKKLYDSQVSHLSGSDASEAQETYEDIVSSKKAAMKQFILFLLKN